MKIYRVKSETNPEEQYRVWRFENGEFACECPKYVFSKKGYQCKHILRVKKYLKGKNDRKKKKL